jgi:hypothetical protein
MGTQQLANILSRLDLLELERIHQDLEIQRLISEGDETAVKFGGLGLKSLEETGAWVSLNTTGGSSPFR